jgi:hypothetical protein
MKLKALLAILLCALVVSAQEKQPTVPLAPAERVWKDSLIPDCYVRCECYTDAKGETVCITYLVCEQD